MTRRKKIWLVLAIVAIGVAFAIPHLPANAETEASRVFDALVLNPGVTVADVGAGSGKYAIASSRLTGANGRVIATELDEVDIEKIRAAAKNAGVANIEVLHAGKATTNLPDSCCDAIFLRRVYHHITQPAEFNASLAAALKPGGRLAVIDFPSSWWNFFLPRPDGLPPDRTGHGIAPAILEQEMTTAGLPLERRIESWSSADYCLIFRKPEAAP